MDRADAAWYNRRTVAMLLPRSAFYIPRRNGSMWYKREKLARVVGEDPMKRDKFTRILLIIIGLGLVALLFLQSADGVV